MSEPAKFENLPQRVQGVIAKCRNGQTLQKFYRFKENGTTEILYSFQPSCKSAPPKSSEEAIETGLLIPNGDGLFDDGTSQTWRAA